MHRRLFFSLAGTGALGLLAACNGIGITKDNALNTVIADVSAVAGGLQGIMPIIGSITGLAPSIIAQVDAAIAHLQVLAEQISVVNSIVGAQPIVQQIETDLNTIVSALAAIPLLPPPVSIALQAASILLPIIESTVNLLVPPKVAARAARVQLTPNQARHILRDLAPSK